GPAHVAPRVRRRERRLLDLLLAQIATGLVERYGERAVDDERLIFGGELHAAERAGDLDADRDALPLRGLERDATPLELGFAVRHHVVAIGPRDRGDEEKQRSQTHRP